MRSRFNSAVRDTTSTHLVETAVEISTGQHEAHGIDCLVHCMRSRINSAARDTISTHLVETAMEIPWDSIKHIALIAWCIKVQFSCKGHNQHSPGRDCRGDPKRQHEAHGIDCLVPRMT